MIIGSKSFMTVIHYIMSLAGDHRFQIHLQRLLWLYHPGQARVQASDWADRLVGKAAITNGFCLWRCSSAEPASSFRSALKPRLCVVLWCVWLYAHVHMYFVIAVNVINNCKALVWKGAFRVNMTHWCLFQASKSCSTSRTLMGSWITSLVIMSLKQHINNDRS